MTTEKFEHLLGVMITPSMLAEIDALVTEPRDRSRVVRRIIELGIDAYRRGEEARREAQRN